MEDIVDILLDEENKDPVVLVDGKGGKIAYEQIAVIPYNGKLYCILKPIDEVNGVADDEAIVFFVNEDDPPTLSVERNALAAMEVFEAYYNLLDAEISKDKRREQQ